MAQVVPGGSIASSLGQAFGTGIGELLGGLAQHKANDLHQRQSVQRWQALGLDSQKAQALAGMPMQLQQQAFDELLPALQLLQPAQQQQQQQSGFQGTQNKMQQSAAPGMKAAMQQPEQQVPMTKSQLKMAQEQKKLQYKANLEEKKEAIKQQHHADKETSKFYKETLASSKSADNNDRRLNRMDTLIKRGKLSNPAWHSFLNTLEKGIFGFGINLHSLENPDSQEFNKISKEFLKDAKETFGNRLTNLDVDTFLKMVPDLSQSDEGKTRIINNMKAYNEANRIRKNTMDEIIKENNGKRPLNLELLVEERAGKKLDALAQEFKEGYGSENKENAVSSQSPSLLDQARKAIGLI